MLPVSGAEQLNISGANKTRPMISQSGAYSTLDRPAPRADAGKKRFHKPAAFAFGFSDSTSAEGCHRSSPAVSA